MSTPAIIRAPCDWPELILELGSPEQRDWVALEHGPHQMTIQELRDAMLRAASALSATKGVVAVSELDPISHTVAVLGAVAAGRVAMLVDPKIPDALFAEVVERAGATTLVGRSAAGEAALGLADLLDREPAVPALLDPAAIGTILLTSGSTGVPKLVPALPRRRPQCRHVFASGGLPDPSRGPSLAVRAVCWRAVSNFGDGCTLRAGVRGIRTVRA